MTTTKSTRFRFPTIGTSVVACLILIAAFGLANLAPRGGLETPIVKLVVLHGALPWALQLGAVLIVFNGCRSNRSLRCPELVFAGVSVAAIGLTWWVPNIVAYSGQTPVDAIVQTIETTITRRMSGETLSFILVHRLCGPLISVLEMRGPLSLAGAGFIYSLCSIAIVTGYLVFTASVCHVGHDGPKTLRSLVRFVLLMLLLWVPSMIRFGIEMFGDSL